MAPNGTWPDFITEFISWAEGVTSPDLFKKWAGISLVAGALERRVWLASSRGNTYPNLYVLLMAAPGVGKHIVADARKLWRGAKSPSGTPAFNVAPDNMTKASLLDRLSKAKQAFIPPKGQIQTYHSLLIAAEEFSVLLPTYDTEYLGALNSIWNIEPSYEELRRTGTVKELVIENPVINLLAGYQPALMATTFPDEAWSSGLARRLIIIHSSTPIYRDLFDYVQEDNRQVSESSLFRQLGLFSQLWGQCIWTPEAAQLIAGWDREGGQPGSGGLPIPTHSKLVNYNSTRTHTLMKLCIVSTVSRTGELVIGPIDARRAIQWLLEAERAMPDVFREMIGKSDSQVIEELHLFVSTIWARDRGRTSVNGDLIRRFLLSRVPHDKVESLLAVAERASILARVAGTQDSWVPRPKHLHGAE